MGRLEHEDRVALRPRDLALELRGADPGAERRGRRGAVHPGGEPDRQRRRPGRPGRSVERAEPDDRRRPHGVNRQRGRAGGRRAVGVADDARHRDRVVRVGGERLERDERERRAACRGHPGFERPVEGGDDSERALGHLHIDRTLIGHAERAGGGQAVLTRWFGRIDPAADDRSGGEHRTGRLGQLPPGEIEGGGRDRDRVVRAGLPAGMRRDRDGPAPGVPEEIDRGGRLDGERLRDAGDVHRLAERQADGLAQPVTGLDAPGESARSERGDRHRRACHRRAGRREPDGQNPGDRHDADPDSHPAGERAPEDDGSVERDEDGQGQRRGGDLSQ